MKKFDVKVGDLVTLTNEMYGQVFCNKPHACLNGYTYESGKKLIKPGSIGIVASIDVPAVYYNRSFVCVDFVDKCCTYRVRPWYNEIKPLKNAKRPNAKPVWEGGVWYEIIE